MAQQRNSAASRDVPTKSKREDFVLTMVQNKNAADFEGCTNQVVKGGGVCITHGAEMKRCCFEGCTKFAQKGGVCRSHGAKLNLMTGESMHDLAQKELVAIKTMERLEAAKKLAAIVSIM